MLLSNAGERSLQLAAELDSRLTALRHSLREAQCGGAGTHSKARGAASRAATTLDELGTLVPPLREVLPATARQLAESVPPVDRCRSTGSANEALLLTDELWNSLEKLQTTLMLPPQTSSGAQHFDRVSLPRPAQPLLSESEQELRQNLELEPEHEPLPEVEMPYRWPDSPVAGICRAVVEHSHIFAPAICCNVHALLPPTQQVGDWSLLYSTRRHGSSLDRMLRSCQDKGPTVVAVRDTRGGTFGGFISTPWPREPSGWSGTGQCFLWAVDSSASEPEVLKFGWTRDGDQFLWTARDSVGIGGGGRNGAYGLWLDKFLASGTTATCDTFGNPALCNPALCEPQLSFSVELIEVWQIRD